MLPAIEMLETPWDAGERTTTFTRISMRFSLNFFCFACETIRNSTNEDLLVVRVLIDPFAQKIAGPVLTALIHIEDPQCRMFIHVLKAH